MRKGKAGLWQAVGDGVIASSACIGVGMLSGKENAVYFGGGDVASVALFAVVLALVLWGVRVFASRHGADDVDKLCEECHGSREKRKIRQSGGEIAKMSECDEKNGKDKKDKNATRKEQNAEKAWRTADGEKIWRKQGGKGDAKGHKKKNACCDGEIGGEICQKGIRTGEKGVAAVVARVLLPCCGVICMVSTVRGACECIGEIAGREISLWLAPVMALVSVAVCRDERRVRVCGAIAVACAIALLAALWLGGGRGEKSAALENVYGATTLEQNAVSGAVTKTDCVQYAERASESVIDDGRLKIEKGAKGSVEVAVSGADDERERQGKGNQVENGAQIGSKSATERVGTKGRKTLLTLMGIVYAVFCVTTCLGVHCRQAQGKGVAENGVASAVCAACVAGAIAVIGRLGNFGLALPIVGLCRSSEMKLLAVLAMCVSGVAGVAVNANLARDLLGGVIEDADLRYAAIYFATMITLPIGFDKVMKVGYYAICVVGILLLGSMAKRALHDKKQKEQARFAKEKSIARAKERGGKAIK